MENPMTWGKAEKIVSRVLDEQDNILPRVRPPSGDIFCGLSLPRQITDALRNAGLLKEENEKEEDSGTTAEPADQENRGEAAAEVHDGTVVR